MKNKHIFSEEYEAKKKALLAAVSEVDVQDTASRSHRSGRWARILCAAALCAILSVGAYAATQTLDVFVARDGDRVTLHAALPTKQTEATGEANPPLRSWRAEEGEVSVMLSIPGMPSDMKENPTANGKWSGAELSGRYITFSGIDLRRCDLDVILDGVTEPEVLPCDGGSAYVIRSKADAAIFNRTLYLIYEPEELVVRASVAYGITDDELAAIARDLQVVETRDTALALPISNEGYTEGKIDNTNRVEYMPGDPIKEEEILSVGAWGTAAEPAFPLSIRVEDVTVLDSIASIGMDAFQTYTALKLSHMTDATGAFIPYTRTEVVQGEDGRTFGASREVTKRLYMITVSAAGIEDAATLRACLHGFQLYGYRIENGEVVWDLSPHYVVDRNPDMNATTSECVYKKDMGDGTWVLCYLLDEDQAAGGLLLSNDAEDLHIAIQ